MSWSYSGDPAEGGVDEIRYLVGDTDSADPKATDEEIEYAIAKWEPIYGAQVDAGGVAYLVAAHIAEQIAAKFASEVSYSADGVSIGVNELQTKYNELAASLRGQASLYDVGGGPDVGGILYSDQPDPMIRPTMWAVGMHDNASAGRQDAATPTPATIPELGYF